MRVAIIDYGSGNLRSAAKAFERQAAGGTEILVTDDPRAVAASDRVVLPGVGAFADCRNGLVAVPGMMAALSESAIAQGRPFLGICVGMQLLATFGLEHGQVEGFDWIPGEVGPLTPDNPELKIPHMGWNELTIEAPAHPVLDDLDAGDAHAYFVHSYHFRPTDPAHILATTDYGGHIAAIVGRDNIVGTQFHPEKSQAVGLRLIENFLNWNP